MSSDITKLAIVDSRIVQTRPAYAVEKGALSLTNAPFQAISATISQHTYNVYVPSENVFVDRRVLWTATCNMSMTVQAATYNDSESLAVPGRDFSLCALPLNSLCSTIQATINDTTSVINAQDVLVPVLRMTDLAENRLVRACPTMLDTFQSYNDAYATMANPIAGFENAQDQFLVPNGAHPGLKFTGPDGSALTGVFPQPAYPLNAGPGAVLYCQVNGVPVAPPLWTAGLAVVAGQLVQYNNQVWYGGPAVGAGNVPGTSANWINPITNAGAGAGAALGGAPLTLFLQWTSTEPIVLSPFVFSDEHEWSSGFFGLNNFQLLMTLVQSPDRVIRRTTRGGRTIAGVGYNTAVNNGFSAATLNVQFLTPSLSVPLPPKSVVPYMEFPRYITAPTNGVIAAGTTSQIQSQTITLPQIPDLLIVYCKGSNIQATDGDWYMPISTPAVGGPRNPLSIQFDNFSGLLSSHTAEELFSMSCKNGLKMSWPEWSGVSRTASGSYAGHQAGQLTPTCGSILVLKPSQDITLQDGQAPSLVGNFTLQFNLSVYNNTPNAQNPQLFVITANSGYFESIRGSSTSTPSRLLQPSRNLQRRSVTSLASARVVARVVVRVEPVDARPRRVLNIA